MANKGQPGYGEGLVQPGRNILPDFRSVTTSTAIVVFPTDLVRRRDPRQPVRLIKLFSPPDLHALRPIPARLVAAWQSPVPCGCQFFTPGSGLNNGLPNASLAGYDGDFIDLDWKWPTRCETRWCWRHTATSGYPHCIRSAATH